MGHIYISFVAGVARAAYVNLLANLLCELFSIIDTLARFATRKIIRISLTQFNNASHLRPLGIYD